MPERRARRTVLSLALAGACVLAAWPARPAAAPAVPSPEQFIGFRVGADNQLARWDTIVAYLRAVAAASDRVRVRDLGTSTDGAPFLALEIASPDTLKGIDRYRQLERKLYFQGGAPTPRERDEIFRSGKAVVLVTCSVHATEVGATQMALELVHRLATDDSPATRKILDNVILVLVPSANPDGQTIVTDWFRRNLGTPFEGSPLPVPYHRYAGHDNNRDMYAFTQKESQLLATLAWKDWLPAVWLDEHQMGAGGARIFVMPATDPVNPNVHPLIYRWNAILGQSQAAALEAEGKSGIIHNATYTNFWQGALAWAGWWHNQIGLLTEVASVRVATPVTQARATVRNLLPPDPGTRDASLDAVVPGLAQLGAPVDTTPRTEYPRPWMGGRWTLRDIVDYQLTSTLALLDTAADRRETMLRQIYEVNRQTIDEGRTGPVTALLIAPDLQQDPREAVHLVERLQMGGVDVYRADAPFSIGRSPYAAGTFVIPMTQVFARYAKDLLEPQVYPEVRRAPNLPPEPPYDITAWSLGLQFGVSVDPVTVPLPSVPLSLVGTPRLTPQKTPAGALTHGSSSTARVAFDYVGADSALAINRLLGAGAQVSVTPASRVLVDQAPRAALEALSARLGLDVQPVLPDAAGVPQETGQRWHQPRVGVYAAWSSDVADEGWTRWVLEQYEFPYTTVRNADLRAGGLRARFDAILLPDQAPRDILDGHVGPTIRSEYRGGIGDAGLEQLQRFVADGGTLIALGAASDLVIDRFAVPVRDLKRTLRRDQHFAPGSILRVQVDTTHPLGYGMAADTYGFYNNSPFFSIVDGPTAASATVVARYPAKGVLASGWLRGEDAMAGRAAVVSVRVGGGHVVLFGLRPQHRAQTHATFPLLFNALYASAADPSPDDARHRP